MFLTNLVFSCINPEHWKQSGRKKLLVFTTGASGENWWAQGNQMASKQERNPCWVEILHRQAWYVQHQVCHQLQLQPYSEAQIWEKKALEQGCWYLVVEWFRDYNSQKRLLVFDKASITKLQSFWGGGSMNVFLQAKHRHNRQVPNSHSPRDECKWPSLQAMEIAHEERVWGLQGWYFGSYGRTTPPQRLHRPHPCKTGDGCAQTKPLRKSNYFLQPLTSIDVSHS